MNAKNNVRIDANAEEAAHIFGQSSIVVVPLGMNLCSTCLVSVVYLSEITVVLVNAKKNVLAYFLH